MLYPPPFPLKRRVSVPDEGTPVDSLMTCSLYGSLDGDWREDDLLSSAEVMKSAQAQSEKVDRAQSLTSFYAAMGFNTAAVSRIGSDTQRFASRATTTTAAMTSQRRVQSGTAFATSSPASSVYVTAPESFESSRVDQQQSPQQQQQPHPPVKLSIQHASSTSLTSDPDTHVCLLDVIQIEFSDIDLFSAQWQTKESSKSSRESVASGEHLVFPSYVVRRQSGKILKEKGRLSVQTERNLEGEISHNVPDIRISAKLSSLHFLIDVEQYKLVKGLLFHNFGETLEQFETKLVNFEDPKIQVRRLQILYTEVSCTVSQINLKNDHGRDVTPLACAHAHLLALVDGAERRGVDQHLYRAAPRGRHTGAATSAPRGRHQHARDVTGQDRLRGVASDVRQFLGRHQGRRPGVASDLYLRHQIHG